MNVFVYSFFIIKEDLIHSFIEDFFLVAGFYAIHDHISSLGYS